MGPSSLSSWVRLIASTLAARGIDAEALLRRAGMPVDRLEDPNARYPLSAMHRLWTLAIDATDDPCFGIDVGRSWHPTTFHALGYSALACATLREALGYVARYCRVVSTGANVDVADYGGEVSVILASRDHSPAQASEAAVQAGLAALVILCRVARGGPVVPQRVMLQQDNPQALARLREFFGCAIEFNAPQNALVFRADDLDAPLPTANPILVQISAQALERYVARIACDTLADSVRSRIIHLLPSGPVEQAAVARSLNLTLRTMQRKLKEEGATFRELFDDTRRRLADQYSKDSTLSSSELAYLLGFSEASSLRRAMKRWNVNLNGLP
jgi:AraC-like DNA-binding protein